MRYNRRVIVIRYLGDVVTKAITTTFDEGDDEGHFISFLVFNFILTSEKSQKPKDGQYFHHFQR